MTVLREPLVVARYGKWTQLALGLICMAAISSPQYVWTLLTRPLTDKLGVGLAELQVTFSLLIILQTFFSPFQGRLVERFGPRLLISRHGHGGAELGSLGSGQRPGRAVPRLWRPRRAGNRYCLYRRRRFNGALVSPPSWICRRRRCGRVWHGAIMTTFPVSVSLGQYGLEQTMTVFGLLFATVGFLASQG